MPNDAMLVGLPGGPPLMDMMSVVLAETILMLPFGSMPVVPVAPLIAVCSCAALQPALTLMTWLPVPVRSSVPLAASGKVIGVPVTMVGGTVAPAPWSVAGASGPTSGFDWKVRGLSR